MSESKYDSYMKEGDNLIRQSHKTNKVSRIVFFLNTALDNYTNAKIYTSENTPEREKLLNKINKIKNQLLIFEGGKMTLESNLESRVNSKLIAILSLFAFIFSALFLSSNFTGSVVSDRLNDFNVLGICFFICSLVFALIWCKKR